MEIQSSEVGTATVLRPEGRLTMVAAPRLRAAVDAAVASGRTRIVVDLGAITFVDSSGLGVLVAGLKRARQAGGDLRIAAANEQVRVVLRLTRLDRILSPHENVPRASDGW